HFFYGSVTSAAKVNPQLREECCGSEIVCYDFAYGGVFCDIHNSLFLLFNNNSPPHHSIMPGKRTKEFIGSCLSKSEFNRVRLSTANYFGVSNHIALLCFRNIIGCGCCGS